MKKYQVTIGYKAVITVDVYAENENDAKANALDLFREKEQKKWFKRNDVTLQDDTFGAYGVLDMDKTWNML